VPGCRSARNLDVHHIVHQAHGGTHELSNIALCCAGHHRALHAGLLEITGLAPYGLKFRWLVGAPLPPGLSADERQAMIDQRIDEILGSVTVTIQAARGETSCDVPRGTSRDERSG
jgi:hypothetical protein